MFNSFTTFWGIFFYERWNGISRYAGMFFRPACIEITEYNNNTTNIWLG